MKLMNFYSDWMVFLPVSLVDKYISGYGLRLGLFCLAFLLETVFVLVFGPVLIFIMVFKIINGMAERPKL